MKIIPILVKEEDLVLYREYVYFEGEDMSLDSLNVLQFVGRKDNDAPEFKYISGPNSAKFHGMIGMPDLYEITTEPIETQFTQTKSERSRIAATILSGLLSNPENTNKDGSSFVKMTVLLTDQLIKELK